MRTVFAKLPIAAAGIVCLALVGAFVDVARAQSPPTQPGGTTPGTSPPGTTTPGTTPPGTTTPGSGTSPGSTTPGTQPGTTPGGSSPSTQPGTSPGTTPGGGATTPGQTPSQPAVDPFLLLLEAFFEDIHQMVEEQFPDASPEFQDWVTGAVMDWLFGDLMFDRLFGAPSTSRASGP